MTRPPGSTTRDGYGAGHRRARALLLEGGPPCWKCGAPATHADHVPPLDAAATLLGLTRMEAAELYTIDGTGPLHLMPACAPCNLRGGATYALAKRRAGIPPLAAELDLTPTALGTSRQW